MRAGATRTSECSLLDKREAATKDNQPPRLEPTWGSLEALCPSLKLYQDNRPVCEVFDHSKDVLHPVTELQIIHLGVKYHDRNLSKLKQE